MADYTRRWNDHIVATPSYSQKGLGAELNPHKLSIKVSGSTGEQYLEGYISKGLAYDLSASWQKSGNFVTNISRTVDDKILQNSSIAPGSYGMSWAGSATKKYYTGSSNVNLTLEFRVFDDAGSVMGLGGMSVLDAIDYVSRLTLPVKQTDGMNVVDAVRDVGRIGANIVTMTGNIFGQEDLGEGISEGVDNLIVNLDKGATKLYDAATSEVTSGEVSKVLNNTKVSQAIVPLANGVKSALTEFTTLTANIFQAPPEVDITIGTWFRLNKCVVERASFTCSQQLTAKGPLFVDIVISVTTREDAHLNWNKEPSSNSKTQLSSTSAPIATKDTGDDNSTGQTIDLTADSTFTTNFNTYAVAETTRTNSYNSTESQRTFPSDPWRVVQ